MLNLFVGVIIDNFNRIRREEGKSILVTQAQEAWRRAELRMRAMQPVPRPPPPPDSAVPLVQRLRKAQQACYKLTAEAGCENTPESAKFDNFIMGCIIVNTVSMSCSHFGQGDVAVKAIEVLNGIFAAIFTAEAAVKILGVGKRYVLCICFGMLPLPRLVWTSAHTTTNPPPHPTTNRQPPTTNHLPTARYFKESWNKFDFLVVCVTDLGVVLKWATGVAIGPIGTTVRAVRVLRIVRLVNKAPTLRAVFNALMLTLPSLCNVSALLFLMYFIYAVLGVQLFAAVQLGDSLNHHANFQTFGQSLSLVVRASTGEAWNYIM